MNHLLSVIISLHIYAAPVTAQRTDTAEQVTSVLIISNPYFEQAQTDILSAFERLRKNRHYRAFVERYSVDESLLFAIIEKESNFNPDARSASDALWYFWLKDVAEKDAIDFLFHSFWIRNRVYDRGVYVDNVILWASYFILTRKRVQRLNEIIDITWSEISLSLLAYNAWIWTITRLLEIYISETESKRFSWDEFTIWITQKVWWNGEYNIKKDDRVYYIEYRDWFNQQDFWDRNDSVSFDATPDFSISAWKIKEMIDYVEKINSIQERGIQVFQKPSSSLPYSPSLNGELFIHPESWEWINAFLRRLSFDPSKTREIFLDLNRKLFEDMSDPQLKMNIWYELPVLSFQGNISDEADMDTILQKAQINVRFRQKIIDFNLLLNPSHTWNIVYIPRWSTWFYNWDTKTSTRLAQSKERMWEPIFHFDTWINSIEVLGDALKGKVFVLDPGHGWPDLWAHPIARDASWNPIRDSKSQIRVTKNSNGNYQEGRTQRVKSESSSGYLHVYESLVVVDVAYRLAEMLRQQWAEVYITRYNQTTWIIDSANMTTPEVSDDVYSDTLTWWQYSPTGNRDRIRRAIAISNDLVAWKNIENTHFLSIHADSFHSNRDLPIIFKYYNWRSWVSESSRSFAHLLAQNTEFRGQQWIAGWQPLWIIHPTNNNIPNSTLIELGNMNHPWTAFLLRQPWWITDDDGIYRRWRYDYAKAIFDWIIAAIWKK